MLSIVLLLSACTAAPETSGVSSDTTETTKDIAASTSTSASTSNSGGSGTTQDAGKTSTTHTSAATTAKTTAPPAPAQDMDGYEFTIASAWMTKEEDIGEHTPLFERYFYDRVKEVESEMNCKVKIIRYTADTPTLRTAIMAGKKVADLVESIPTWIPQNASAGYLVDWNSISGINLDDPKWLSYASEISKYKGKVYGISFLKPPEARYCIMFNKTLLEKNGVKAADLYNMVRQKKWTWEELRQAAVKATNITGSASDTFGLAGKYEYIANGMLASFGGSLVKQNASGKYVYNLNSSASLAAMNFYNQLVNTDKVVWVQDAQLSPAAYRNINEQSYVQAFNSGKVAFLLWESWVLNQYTKLDADFDYGILPLPLGGSMTEYVSPATNMRVMCVTSTNDDLDKTVPILNRLAEPIEGYENEDAWWEDIQTDYFNSDDKDSLEMYKLILDSSMQDPGLSIETLETAFYESLVMKSIYWKELSVAAAADSMKDSYNDVIDSIYNK